MPNKRTGRPNFSPSKHDALKAALLGQAGDAVLTGKVKPPKSKEQGEYEVMSKKPKNMERQLRKDF